ncbi:MAG TPA: DUF6797 domain-containing protein [Tepidisphaeraceae bacterium]|nr:DUF6797 domain-containing protein [Tepidisphaeraceae bacterium]
MLHRRFALSAAALAAASLLGVCSFAAAGDAPGLVGEYYQLKEGGFANVEGKTPFLVRVDKRIDFPDTNGDFYKTKLSQNFLAVWTGSLKVDTAGETTFYLAVDDGARLSIDGKVILEDITSNGIAEKSAKVDLTAGEHAIKVEFYQKGGGSAVVLSWQTPGEKREPIPAKAFSHDKAAEQVTWNEKAWKKARGADGGATAWDNLDYGPFLSASIQADFPADNMTYKGVAVKLGKVKVGDEEQDASMCFDTQLCRVSAGWTGGFLHLKNVAFTGDHGPCPTVAGDVKFGTRNAIVWAQKDGSFTDPRIALDGEPFGGMPRDYLHYKGLYRHGDQVIFSYSVNGMDVLDLPGVKQFTKGAGFTRTFSVGASDVTQTLIVADVDGDQLIAVGSEKSGVITHGPDTLIIYSAGQVAGTKFTAADITNGKGKEIRFSIPPHAKAESFELVIYDGPTGDGPPEESGKGGNNHESDIPDLATLTKGGPAHWATEMPATGKLQVEPTREAAKAAYVLDEVGYPDIPSNWPRLRFSGFDFFPDGKSAAVCTWNGDVYIVKGIDDTLEHLTWRRIAGGTFQTLGLKIIDGKIYVHGRDQITILHDLDGDGEADFYENFNNDVAITDHFHEFAFDLQTDKEGNLYTIKAGGVNPGGQGFQRPITRDHGTLMKISKDGSKLEVIATGFRAPNGMCVREDGQAVTGDNQGTWVPNDRLNWIKPGMFCGVVDLAHRKVPPTTTDNPLCWFIYPGWDNSCGDPVFVTSDKWGQPKGDLFYLSYGQTSLMHILPEEKDGQMQGGAVRFPWHFESGSMRARFNPVDGQLYVCGFQGWQTNAHKPTAFERVRYTGKKSYMPTGMHVKDNGIELTFAEPFKKDSVEDAGAWAVEEWNYNWTGSYGTPEVKVSDPKQRGHDTVEVKSVKLSADGKTIFLEMPSIQPVMQMLIRGKALEAVDGTPVDVEVANTINTVKGKTLVVEVGKVEMK